VFGISFTELLLVLIVALVVVGPQKLPRMLGTLGTWIGKLRQLSTDMRRQTGIDEILREEGLTGGLNELRGIMRGDAIRDVGAMARYPAARNTADPYAAAVEYDRSREYPTEGPDAYGAIPEDLLEATEPSDGAEPIAPPALPDNGAPAPAQAAGAERTGVVGPLEAAPARNGSKVTA
jgi:sec-independent protein translocase protein TatB